MNEKDLAEHLTCINYDNGEQPLVDYLKMKKGERFSKMTLQNKIILVVEGRIMHSYSTYIRVEVQRKSFFLLPSGYDIEIEIIEDSVLLCFRLDTIRQLCNRFQFEKLNNIECEIDPKTPCVLSSNTMLQSYTDSLLIYISDGLRCCNFHEMKVKELLFIFRIYYTKQDMKRLFYPLLTHDLSFSDKVIQASLTARSIQELADATGYTVSGFSKRFTKVFEEPAYQWLQQKRADRIFKYIHKSYITLKELADKEGFSSLSELNRFCKRFYGNTPAKLRAANRLGEN